MQQTQTLILLQALHDSADAISLVPTERGLNIEFRVGGRWYGMMPPSRKRDGVALLRAFRKQAGIGARSGAERGRIHVSVEGRRSVFEVMPSPTNPAGLLLRRSAVEGNNSAPNQPLSGTLFRQSRQPPFRS